MLFKSIYRDDDKKKLSYINHRREMLRKQTEANSVADLSVVSICKKIKATSGDHALRICAQEGPQREFNFLLEHLPADDIHKKGGQSGKNALHFAYSGNKPNRARALIDRGIHTNAMDKEGKVPEDYKKTNLRS
jgi:hypothetical protein